MAQAYRLLISAGVLPREIKQCCTDSFLFVPGKKRKAACLALGEVSFRSLKRSRGCLVTHTGVSSTDSAEQVFRVEEVGSEKRLLGNHKLPIRDDDHELIIPDRTWKDFFQEDEVEKLVLGDHGCCIEGIAGTGKTTLAKRLIQSLRDAGKKVFVCSKMHTTSLLLGGVTVNHLCFKYVNYGTFRGDFLVIDEISQLDLHLWNQLQKLQHMGCKFICLGDYNQFYSISPNTWAGSVLPDTCIQESNLLQILCDNNRICLKEPKRSDVELFNYYASLIDGGSRYQLPLAEVLAEARVKFPAKPGFPDLSLCISHMLRRTLNRQQNRATAPADSLQIQTVDGTVLLHKGLRLLARLQQKKSGCLNNAIYVVRDIQGDHSVNIECEISGRCLEVDMGFVREHMHLAYCCTIASIQGKTVRGRLRIHTQHPHFTLRCLFVCASRATSKDLLEIC